MKGNLNLIISKINFFREKGLYKKIFINLFLFIFIFAFNEVYAYCDKCNAGQHSQCQNPGITYQLSSEENPNTRQHFKACCCGAYKYPNTYENHDFQTPKPNMKICWKCQYFEGTRPTPPQSVRTSYYL